MAEKQIPPPLKYIDMQNAVNPLLRQHTPNSLAFFLGDEIRGIPQIPADFDQRRLPFNDISLALRDQNQRRFLNPHQNTPFSMWNSFSDVRKMTNAPK